MIITPEREEKVLAEAARILRNSPTTLGDELLVDITLTNHDLEKEHIIGFIRRQAGRASTPLRTVREEAAPERPDEGFPGEADWEPDELVDEELALLLPELGGRPLRLTTPEEEAFLREVFPTPREQAELADIVAAVVDEAGAVDDDLYGEVELSTANGSMTLFNLYFSDEAQN